MSINAIVGACAGLALFALPATIPCDNCFKNSPTFNAEWTNISQPLLTPTFTPTGGNNGQCGTPAGCDIDPCRWKGSVSVENGRSTNVYVEIKLGAAVQKTCATVIPGGTCTWNMPAAGVDVACKESGDTTKKVTIRVRVQTGTTGNPPVPTYTWVENSMELICKKCAGSGD